MPIPSTRCPKPCGKYAYDSKKDAEKALTEIHKVKDDWTNEKYSDTYARSENRVYQCQYKKWHVTGSTPPK